MHISAEVMFLCIIPFRISLCSKPIALFSGSGSTTKLGGTSNGRSSFQQQNLHTLWSDIHLGAHLHMGSHKSILKICITCCCEFDYASYYYKLAILQWIIILLTPFILVILRSCDLTFVAINENYMWCLILAEYWLFTSLIGNDGTFKIHPSMCSY